MEELAQMGELVNQLEREVLSLDRGGDGSGVHLLFRTVHNLKSLSAYLGFKTLGTGFHRLEDGLDRIRRGREAWSSDWTDQVLDGIDLARAALGHPALARATVQAAPAGAPSPQWGVPLSEAQETRLDRLFLEGQGIYRLEKLFTRGLERESFESLPVMEDLAELGTLIAVHPGFEGYAAGPPEQVVKFLFASHQSFEALSAILFDPLIQVRAAEAVAPMAAAALRCLVIEDDPVAGGVLRQMLKKFGPCTLATTARQGFTLFRQAWERQEPFQILILDLNLPDMNGNAVLKAIRGLEFEKRVPLALRCLAIIATASSEVDDMAASLSFEADGYLRKPVAPDLLQAKITELLELRSEL